MRRFLVDVGYIAACDDWCSLLPKSSRWFIPDSRGDSPTKLPPDARLRILMGCLGGFRLSGAEVSDGEDDAIAQPIVLSGE